MILSEFLSRPQHQPKPKGLQQTPPTALVARWWWEGSHCYYNASMKDYGVVLPEMGWRARGGGVCVLQMLAPACQAGSTALPDRAGINRPQLTARMQCAHHSKVYTVLNALLKMASLNYHCLKRRWKGDEENFLLFSACLLGSVFLSLFSNKRKRC